MLYREVESKIKEHSSQLEQIAIDLKKFGAKGDGVTDDTKALKDALNYCSKYNRVLKPSSGEYLITSNILLDDLDLPPVVVVDYNHTLSIIGEDVKNTIFLLGENVTKFLTYSKSNTRSFVIENLSFRSKSPYDDLTLRANTKVLELLNCPYSKLKKLNFVGFDDCVQIKNCWFSQIHDIYINKCNKGLFIDGRNSNLVDFGGMADHLDIKNIIVGSGIKEYGMKISGSNSTIIEGFDCEGGYSGNPLIIEGCHNLFINSLYFEIFNNASPILIKGYDTLKSISQFSTNIEISNAKFYGIIGIPAILLKKGIDNLKIKNCRIYKEQDKIYEGKQPPSYKSRLIHIYDSFSEGINKYYRNISVLENIFSSNDELDIAKGDMCLSFNENGVIYTNKENISYSCPTFEKGTIIKPLMETYWTHIEVQESGTNTTLSGITCNTIQNSTVITVSDSSKLIPNTYCLINGSIKNKILAINDNQVVLSVAIDETLNNVSFDYLKPVLKYFNKAIYKSKTEETFLKTSMTAGEMYFDKDNKIPRFYDGVRFWSVVQSGNGTVTDANTEQVVTFPEAYPTGKVPNVVAVSRKSGSVVTVLRATNTGFTIQSTEALTGFYYIATL